jgi:hypothetical protein
MKYDRMDIGSSMVFPLLVVTSPSVFFVGSYEDQLKVRKWPIFQKIVWNQHLLALIAQLTFSVPGT